MSGNPYFPFTRRTGILLLAIFLGMFGAIVVFAFSGVKHDGVPTELQCFGTTGVYTNYNGTAAVANDPNCVVTD